MFSSMLDLKHVAKMAWLWPPKHWYLLSDGLQHCYRELIVPSSASRISILFGVHTTPCGEVHLLRPSGIRTR